MPIDRYTDEAIAAVVGQLHASARRLESLMREQPLLGSYARGVRKHADALDGFRKRKAKA